jgi:hypothetical protein
MAIAQHAPAKLYARNRGLLNMTAQQRSDFAGTARKGLPARAAGAKSSNPGNPGNAGPPVMPMKPPGGMPMGAMGGANLPVMKRMVPLMVKAGMMKQQAMKARMAKKGKG